MDFRAQYSPWVQERQGLVLRALWGIEFVASALRSRVLDAEVSSLGHVVVALVSELDLPGSLKEVGVGSERFDGLVNNSMEDAWTRTNHVPITKPKDVKAILKMASGDDPPTVQVK